MKKRFIIISIASAIIIAGAGVAVYAFTRPQTTMPDSMPGMSMSASDGTEITNSATYQQYASLHDETYDKTFLSNMIVHHQGAVDMAKLAVTNAKHQELKDMANTIITAQQKEITNMTAWQKQWNYPSTSTDSMMGSMDGMTAMLTGKTGDDFDKTFIEQMIIYHQSAIGMATPGATNAYHQDVKDLSKAIVTAQTGEITQMQQWQKAWGYTR